MFYQLFLFTTCNTVSYTHLDVYKRQLIRKKKIIPMRMSEEDIFDFERVHLINAMTELGKMVVHIDQIFKR